MRDSRCAGPSRSQSGTVIVAGFLLAAMTLTGCTTPDNSRTETIPETGASTPAPTSPVPSPAPEASEPAASQPTESAAPFTFPGDLRGTVAGWNPQTPVDSGERAHATGEAVLDAAGVPVAYIVGCG